MGRRKLPAVNARRVLRALRRAGFVVMRVSGSHYHLSRPEDPSRAVIVPYHSSRDLKTATLHSIIEQSGVSIEEFIALL
jgi:predicted RNA binding protein YcfA (HicA-like mRNA interferase family)